MGSQKLPPFLPTADLPRDPQLKQIEEQMRTAVRDAVHRASRKPFCWGGLIGYHQLEAMAEALHAVPQTEGETGYLHHLVARIDRVVETHRTLAQDLREAHAWLRRIADCLRYPPDSSCVSGPQAVVTPDDKRPLTSRHVHHEMDTLLSQFQPHFRRQPAQAALYHTWRRLWKRCGPELLYCYDIPGLPPDNLKLEGLFGRLRCHQRRISGRKSTRELRDFGHYQVLFVAESEVALLKKLQHVPVATYQAHRRRLAQAEAPRQFLHRLHRDPGDTMRKLVDQHAARRATLARQTPTPVSPKREGSLPVGHPNTRNPPEFSDALNTGKTGFSGTSLLQPVFSLLPVSLRNAAAEFQ